MTEQVILQTEGLSIAEALERRHKTPAMPVETTVTQLQPVTMQPIQPPIPIIPVPQPAIPVDVSIAEALERRHGKPKPVTDGMPIPVYRVPFPIPTYKDRVSREYTNFLYHIELDSKIFDISKKLYPENPLIESFYRKKPDKYYQTK